MTTHTLSLCDQLPIGRMPALCVLCLAAALAALSRLVGTVGPVVRCEPCDAGALLQCKPLPKDCAERTREPGCGCCMTCALGEGQACGVYTARCGSGLSCRHQPGEIRPLQALLEGRGVCTPAASKRLNSIPIPQRPGRDVSFNRIACKSTCCVLLFEGYVTGARLRLSGSLWGPDTGRSPLMQTRN